MVLQANGSQKKVGVIRFILDKIDHKPKKKKVKKRQKWTLYNDNVDNSSKKTQ